MPRRGRGRPPAPSAASSFASVFGPIPGPLQPPRRGGLAQLVGGSDAERAADLDRALRPEAEQPPEADELRRDLALELVELRDPPGLDELAQPRLDPRPDAAQLSHAPARTSSATGAFVSRISSAARR